MDTVWEHLLPNMKDAPLPEDQVLVSNLADQLKNLSIAPPQLQQSSSLEDQINGITYTLEDNQFSLATISISFNDEAEVTLITKLGEKNVIRVGRGQWLESFALILEPFMNRIMSSFTWSAEDQLQLSLLFIEMPFLITLDINILENMLILKQRINVNMGPLEFDDIIGRIQ